MAVKYFVRVCVCLFVCLHVLMHLCMSVIIQAELLEINKLQNCGKQDISKSALSFHRNVRDVASTEASSTSTSA